MKTANFVGLCLTLLLFSACSQDVDPPIDPPGSNLPGEKLLLEVDFKAFAGSDNNGSPINHFLATANTREATVTLWTDTAAKKYKRYFYDSQGRLERIHQEEGAATPVRDLLVERPAPNAWNISYGDGTGKEYTDLVRRTERPDGTEQIAITSLEYPGFRLEEHIDLDNRLRFREVIFIRENNSGPYKNRCAYLYDGAKRLTATIDTNFTEAGKFINRQTITVTKDVASNNALTDFMELIVGSDMQWLVHSGEFGYIIPNWYFDNFLSPYTALQAGSVTAMKTAYESSPDGINFIPGNTSRSFDMKYVYDVKGRMTSERMSEDGRLIRGMTIKYFD